MNNPVFFYGDTNESSVLSTYFWLKNENQDVTCKKDTNKQHEAMAKETTNDYIDFCWNLHCFQP